MPDTTSLNPPPEPWMSQREYDRIVSEIRQSQEFRIRILLGALTAVSVLLGILPKLDSTPMPGAVLYGTLHLALFSCILMTNNYTRSIDCQSMYLGRFFREQWMQRFVLLSAKMENDAKNKCVLYAFAPWTYSTGRALQCVYFGLSVGTALASFNKNNDWLAVIISCLGSAINIAIMFMTASHGRKYYETMWSEVP